MNTTNNMGDARSARWARHPGDRFFHVVDCDRPYSVVTLCNGAWNVEDEFVEWLSSPAEAERCACCQRSLIDPIERGLAELVNVTEHEHVNSRFDIGELGGEG